LRTIAESLIGPKALSHHSLDGVDFFERAQRMFTRFPLGVRFFILFVLWFVEYEAALFHLTRFTHLSIEKRHAFFSRRFGEIKNHYRFAMLRLVQAFCFAAYYADPTVEKDLGYVEKQAGASPQRVIPLGKKVESPIYCDALVIGTGAGGAVVAKELAEAGKDVLMIEEGGKFTTDDFRQATTHERYLAMYRDGGFTASLGQPPVVIPLGKTLGGTTTINSGTCFRLPEKVLQSWQHDFGLGAISYLDLQKYFERVETHLGVARSSSQILGANYQIIDSGVARLGLSGQALARNAPDCVGSGECCFGCPSGAKLSMNQSYVPLALKNGAKLITYLRARKIITKNNRVLYVEAVKVDATSGKLLQKVRIYPQNLIVSCGTLYTPILLKASGIARDSKALGRHLTIHPTGKVVAIYDQQIRGQHGVPQSYELDFMHDQGIMFESIFYPPWLMAANFSRLGDKHFSLMTQYEKMAVFAFLISDAPNGRVVGLPGDKPLVFYNFGDREHRLFLQGLRFLCRVMLAAGAKEVYPCVHGVEKITKESDIEILHEKRVTKKHLESAAFHPLGTCRMGVDAKRSVVDGDLKVHGTDNLYVCDGSIFPSSLGVNPQLSIYGLARLMATRLLSS
jgi:choline dehydrogenase-like flavoprotein